MPVASIPADQAVRNLRGSRLSLWPDDRLPGDRLTGVAKVDLRPTFRFSLQDRILTLGSCFAREIETRLSELGFDVPMVCANIPAEEPRTTLQNDLLIKFTIQSIENELKWAAGEAPPPPEKLFLELGDGVWHDPQLIVAAPALPMDRARARRALVQEAIGQFASCRVVIITLGLAEAWFDEDASLYLNTAPPGPALSRYPGRFRLDVLSYEDILESLERIWDLFARRGAPDVRMLITVSPVPFKATFSGEDAITANSYSKAVQRAACQAFVARHEGVDYFPSYEIVTMTARELAYERDNIHVAPTVVRYITDNVLRAYAPELDLVSDEIGAPPSRKEDAEGRYFDFFVRAKHQMAERSFDQAEATSRELLSRFDDVLPWRDRAVGHYLLGAALSGQRAWAAAAQELQKAAELDPRDGVMFYKLGQCFEHLKQWPEAVSAYERAVASNSSRPEFAERLAWAREKAPAPDSVRAPSEAV